MLVKGGKAKFIKLSDTPDSYTGHSLKFARVNVGETALEFHSGAEVWSHADLDDMPDVGGTNIDHDVRYFTHAEVLDLIEGAAFSFHPSDTADGTIANYNIMYDVDTDEAETTIVVEITADDTLIKAFITESDQPTFTSLSAGVYAGQLHLSATTAGKKDTKVYWTLSKRATGGAETILITSEESILLTNTNTHYEIHGSLTTDQTILSDDRLVFKVYGNQDTGAGGDATATLYMEGTTATRIDVLTHFLAFDDRYVQVTGDTMTGNLNMGANSISGVTTLGTTNNIFVGKNLTVSGSITTAGTLEAGAITGTSLTDGTATLDNGSLSGVTTVGMNNQFANNLADGTAPFIITSTTVVPNLNVDQVDGYDFDQDVTNGSSPAFAGTNITGLVPYTGATTNLNMGLKYILLGDTISIGGEEVEANRVNGIEELRSDAYVSGPEFRTQLIYDNNGSNLQVGDGTDTVILAGPSSSEVTWVPSIASFSARRAGGVAGSRAAQFNYSPTASGSYSLCGGYSCTSSGSKSVAFGNSVTASALLTWAYGDGFTNSVESTFAVGFGAKDFTISATTMTFNGVTQLGAPGSNHINVATNGNQTFVGSAGFYPRLLNQSGEPAAGTGATQLDTNEMCIWTDTDDSKCYFCFNHGGTVKTTELI